MGSEMCIRDRNFAASFLAFSRLFLSSLSGRMLADAPGEIRSFGLVILSGILMESSSLFGSSRLEFVATSVEGVLNCDICSARCLSARHCFVSLLAIFWRRLASLSLAFRDSMSSSVSDVDSPMTVIFVFFQCG